MEIVNLLLEVGADPDSHGTKDHPILCTAACNAHEALVKLLLESGTSVKSTNPLGQGPLHLAARTKGSRATMEALLRYGADINARDNSDETCLFGAVISASIDEIEFLIENGTDVNAQNAKGETCLHDLTRIEKNAYENIERLIDNGIKENVHELLGESRIHYLIRIRKKRLEITQLLLENGARPEVRNLSGKTCLHILPPWLYPYSLLKDLLQLLTSHGMDINIRDDDGNTPLYVACRNWPWYDLERFINLPGLDFNARNRCGKAPLHTLVRFYSIGVSKIIEQLIRKGADVNCEDSEGRIPLDLAANNDIAQVLVQQGGRRGNT